MHMALRWGIALSLFVLAPSLAAAAAPAAVAIDQLANAAMPARMDALRIPSGSDAMNAIAYTPGGSGPHPALILLHGLPGNEQNLDLAQAARRAGFVVLTLHYRGSWGSPGKFSYANAIQDGSAALAWLRTPAQVARFQIDPRRVVMAGHSVGGFVAWRTAAAHPEVRALLLIDAWNIGAVLPTLQTPGGRKEWNKRYAGNVLPLAGTSPDALAEEILATGASLDMLRDAARLAGRPVLVIGAQRANGAGNTEIADAIVAAGGRDVTADTMPTDHGFNDHRIALISTSVAWLDRFKTEP